MKRIDPLGRGGGGDGTVPNESADGRRNGSVREKDRRRTHGPEGKAPEDRRPPASPRKEVLLFLVLAGLGTIASYLNVKIPHTDIYIEGRFAFGFMGFALLRRFPAALLLACVLAGSGPRQLPLHLVFLGNMLFTVPALAMIRSTHDHLLARLDDLWLYGAGWFLTVLLCYQAFNTPVLWAILGLLEGKPVWPAVVNGWREQPFLVESLLVGIVSAAGMMVIRGHEALRRSRRELAITLDSIGDGVIATDSRGRVSRMNPVAEELTGWPLEEARGEPLAKIFRIIDARTREPSQSPVEQVLRTGATVKLGNHTSLLARDGAERQIADSAAPLRKDDGGLLGAVMVFRDISREYRDRETLRESEHRFRSFVENANDIVYSLTPEGVFTYISPNWLEYMGEPAEAAVGRPFEPYVHPDDVTICREFLETVLRTGERRNSVEYRTLNRDGTVRWHTSRGSALRDENGEVIGYVGIARDVTDQKRVEETLRRRTEELELAQRMARLGSWRFAPETGEIWWSREMYRIFELDPSEGPPTAAGHFEILHPADRDRCAEVLDRALTKGEDYEIEFRIILPDGAVKHLFTLGKAAAGPDGKVSRIFGTTQDITETVRLHEEKAGLEAQFQQAQKLESVGRLAGGVAHDLNNLLTPILGYGEMLLDHLGGDEAGKTYIGEILHAGRRSRDLVRQLLAFGRKQVLDIRPTDINEVLARFERLLRRTIREDIDIRMVKAPSLPPVLADVGQLEQVIMNLAVNAQDAMAEGGTLTIETAPAPSDKGSTADVGGDPPGGSVMLRVSDTGCGMDEATRTRLFEPFFTTKEQDKGTGLGLATVYGIVKQHLGSIRVSSKPSEGSIFSLFLPVADETGTAAESPPEAPENLGGNETILLVEDNEQVRHLARAILRRQGYTVLTAKDGKEALEVCDRHQGPLHLLFTDVVMPDMNGRELSEKISHRRPEAKVLFMSGYTGNVIARHGVVEEGLDFIQKPFSVKDLAAKVRKVLAGIHEAGSS